MENYINSIKNNNCITVTSRVDIEQYINAGLIISSLYDFTFIIENKNPEFLIEWLNKVPKRTFILWPSKSFGNTTWHLFFQKEDAIAAKLAWS
jgi:hypothetical protein